MKKMFMVGIIFLASLVTTSFAFADSNSASGSSSSVNVSSTGSKGYKGTGAAFAPGLTASGLSCQGSTSAGAGGAGWGVAFGTTVMDRDCNTRENAKMAAGLGGLSLAKEVACNIKQIRDAYLQLGKPCMVDGGVRSANRRLPNVDRSAGYPNGDDNRAVVATMISDSRGH